jgi:putative GTP pyrophosphokinase
MRPLETFIEQRKERFVRNSLMSDEFLDFVNKNMKPIEKQMSYYQCAIMEVETKFKVLNEQYSLEYDRNPIEDIKSRVKSMESLIKKIRKKDIPLTLSSIEENIHDIAGVRVICSFLDDIYMLADCLLSQDDITLLEKKDYIKNPKPNGYKSYHMVVTIPVYLTDGPVETKVEIQIRTVAMDFWASLEHKIYYKSDFEAPDYLQRELKACADVVDMLDAKMFSLNQAILEWNRRDDGKQEEREPEKSEIT